jgi:transposase
MAQIEGVLERIRPQIDEADFDLVRRMVATVNFVMTVVRGQRAIISRLRRIFGISSSEKTDAVLATGNQHGTEGGASRDGASPSTGTSATTPEPSSPGGGASPTAPKGHGRVPVEAYANATKSSVAHESLAPGCGCPDCCRGKLYDLKEPASILRIVGQPALAALRWDCQRLRCNTCGKVYTAKAPQEAQGPKFDETAVSMLALCHYDAGLPLNRIERLQHNLQTPIPSSTQWDVLNESASTFKPVFDEMARQAAQGQVVHDDDTFVRILALMGKRRAELLKKGELPSPERTGLFTTAIVSITDRAPIALFYTGRKYAGENLADLLKVREADLGPPILMSDALDSRNVPKGHTVIESNCAAHARRGFVDQIPNFPAECKHVLEELRKIFVVDAQCQKAGLSPEERLRVHQRDSGPVMEALHTWMTNELATKRAEPNSGLGHAYNYMLKRWHKFTLFLHKAGAPIDNNIAERTLKKAICHRRNSLFYRSQRGADVGDMFMSLIHTAQLRGENPFDFLTELQRHAKAAAENPADWLPWTYRETLARLAKPKTAPSASMPSRQ